MDKEFTPLESPAIYGGDDTWEVHMNCHRCGGPMIFKKLFDYGGYSCGWKCILCGEIIDQIRENRQWLKKAMDQNKIGRKHSVMTYRDRVGFEWDGM